MSTIEQIVRGINRELSPQFEERLRTELADKDREWLIDQLVRLTLDAHSLEDMDRASALDQKARARAERVERVRSLAVDSQMLSRFQNELGGLSRERLIESGYLLSDAPAKGTQMLAADHRTAAGEELLQRAKDLLFALLFGNESTNTPLSRIQQELLTLAVPRSKSSALDFMRASTELAAAGTWQDPQNVSNDERADNVLLEVQFGETADEVVGTGIVTALSLINSLEINEQVLYARMVNVEESTLIR